MSSNDSLKNKVVRKNFTYFNILLHMDIRMLANQQCVDTGYYLEDLSRAMANGGQYWERIKRIFAMKQILMMMIMKMMMSKVEEKCYDRKQSFFKIKSK